MDTYDKVVASSYSQISGTYYFCNQLKTLPFPNKHYIVFHLVNTGRVAWETAQMSHKQLVLAVPQSNLSVVVRVRIQQFKRCTA